MFSLIHRWFHQIRARGESLKRLCEPPETLSLREIFDMPPFHPGAGAEKTCR